MGDTAPPHQINHQHDHVAGGGAGQDELPQFTTSRAELYYVWSGAFSRGPEGRLGPGRREGQLLVPPRRRCSRVPYWSSCLPSPLAHPVLEGAWLQK